PGCRVECRKGAGITGGVRYSVEIRDRDVDPLAIGGGTPLHSTECGPRADLRLPQHLAGARIESIVDPALLYRSDDRFRAGGALVGDLVRSRAKVEVRPGRARAVGEGRDEASHVPEVAAILIHRGQVPGHQLRDPFDLAGVHVEGDDRVDKVPRIEAVDGGAA